MGLPVASAEAEALAGVRSGGTWIVLISQTALPQERLWRSRERVPSIERERNMRLGGGLGVADLKG